MFSDEETKGIQESSFMRAGDEILSIREVCLNDKCDKKDLGFCSEPLLLNSGKNDLFRDGFFAEGLEPQQARFAWTEEDGNIAALVSEPGFGTTGTTTFGDELDVGFKNERDYEDTSSSAAESTTRNGYTFLTKTSDLQPVTSTSKENDAQNAAGKRGRVTHKVDKSDPRSRYHYVKYVKRQGRSIKLWECGICCREFQHQYTLMRHMPTHTDERNFHCDVCGKSFRQLSTLSQHRAIHSSDRPYSCEECRKTFNRVSTLISHRKTHSNDKPYRCQMCPKGFHQKGNLRNHMFTHTNERPYRCNICNKGFNQQSNLVCHKNKVHQESSNCCISLTRSKIVPLTVPPTEGQADSTRPSPVAFNEVSSSMGSYPCTTQRPHSSTWQSTTDEWEPKSDGDSPLGSGVIVDAIKTYHMSVAIATNQTPFALLKPEHGSPVLVKVVDTNLPGGKQMLVPATAEDLSVGGKIILRSNETSPSVPSGGAVQIRVPVVATVVPRIRPGGRLHLEVEEPHHAFHTASSADGVAAPPQLPHLQPASARAQTTDQTTNAEICAAPAILPSCVLPPPPPSPPLDLIPLDLFDHMECIPLGPQITPVDLSTLQDSQPGVPDFCIGEYEVKPIIEF